MLIGIKLSLNTQFPLVLDPPIPLKMAFIYCRYLD